MKPKSKKNQQRLLQTDCHIGIVGSGLGGLSAALAILRCGMDSDTKRRSKKNKSGQNEATEKETVKEHDTISSPSSSFQGRITIYERDLHASDRKEGYGMTLTYNPTGPLAQLDILESVAQKDCPSRSHYLFNEKGEVMGYYGNAFHGVSSVETGGGGADQTFLSCRGAGQRGNLRVPRAELRSILMEKIKETDQHNGSPKVRIEWGKRLLSYVDRPAVEKLNQLHNQHSKIVSDDIDTTTTKRPVLLQFEDGSSDEVDLLIGADGVNSVVAKQYLSTQVSSKLKQPAPTNDVSPQYLGIFIVIGISYHLHPLIDERGYYTLGGRHRLFIMPYEGSRLEPQPRRTMWQLSFPIADKDEAQRLSKLDPADLHSEVLRRCGSWHEPFPDMVKTTPLTTIWGT
jgi:salicylate hydroxylase